MTEQIKRKLQEEMNVLEHELVHELPKEIKKAAALGDLSENAEYHMAKQRQEFVKARLRQLGTRMADLALINMDNIPKDKVGLGSTVRVYDNYKNEEVEYKLVTSEESDVTSGKISTSSPIGRALLNKKVGDTAIVVTPNGKREMEILNLTTIHDQTEAEAEHDLDQRLRTRPAAFCWMPSSAGSRWRASIPTCSPSWAWSSTSSRPFCSDTPTATIRRACSATPGW